MRWHSAISWLRKTQTNFINISTAVIIAVNGLGAASPLFLSQTANAAPASQVVYDALPSVSPKTNYPSQPFQAQQTAEFGDSIHLGGTNRVLNSVTVTMSNWALASTPSNLTFCSNNPGDCSSHGYKWPITLNVYSTHLDAQGAPDQKLATVTKKVFVPWLPAGPVCPSDATGWTDSSGQCDHGVAFNTTFNLGGKHVFLPSDVIVSLAYNTKTWGYNPVGAPGPYDSLNVAVPPNQAVTVGSDNSTNAVFWNTKTCRYYSDTNSAAQCNAGNYGLYQYTNWDPYGTIALRLTATAPDIHFVGSPKYVRAGNAGDIDAQARTYAGTTQVQFYVDGNTSNPIAGYNAGRNNWRLKTPLSAGQHTITGRAMIYGNWYPIARSAAVYSLGLPTVSYVLPNTNRHYFRPTDNPVRVKVSDQYDQFKNLDFSLYKYNTQTAKFKHVSHGYYRVKRDQCDLREAGKYVLCDMSDSSSWGGLAAGTYYVRLTTETKANNGIRTSMKQYWSKPFTVDGTRPVLSNFKITDVHSAYGKTVSVRADATDANGIKNVTFYVTAPRASDGKCTGNVTKLVPAQGTLASGSTYTATLNTSSLNGPYCLNAIAEDVAANHSSPILHIPATFDNTPPAAPTDLVIYQGYSVNSADRLPANGYSNSRHIHIAWKPSKSKDVSYYWFGTKNDPHHKKVYPTHTDANGDYYYDGYMTPGHAPYYYTVIAVDDAGNESPVATTYKIGLDLKAPSIAISSISENPISGSVTIAGTASDNGPSGLRNGGIRLSFRPIVNSNVQSPVKTFFASVDSSGNWTLTFNTKDYSVLTDGQYRIVARANDNTGTSYRTSNTTAATKDVAIDNTAPALTINSYSGTNTKPTITGTTDINSNIAVAVAIDGGTAHTATNNGDGTWSFAVGSPLTVGTHTAVVTAVDLAGNITQESATITVTSAPAPQTASTNDSNSNSNSGQTNVTVTPSNNQHVLGAHTNTPNSTSGSNSKSSGNVKGTSTNTPSSNNASSKNSTSKNANVLKFFGLAWYWWLLIALAVLALIYYVYRQASTEDKDVKSAK